ncbi:MAG: DUF4956 domain-containing protein [Lachnospiraceae bacterium]|nr:DUF4956 domain-containing protein [Lachnospiraceae bacterium]
MFTSIIDSTSNFAVNDAILMTACSLVMGLLISLTYISKGKYTKSYAITLVVLPIIVQVVILMVNGSIGAGIAIAGAFSLVRFRSQPASSLEISTIFLAMAVGLSNAMGYLTFSLFITVVFCVVLFVLSHTKYGEKRTETRIVRITIPENLDYSNVFDDLFEKYTKSLTLDRVRTTNMGSMFEMTYTVEFKKDVKEKEFIDDVRCRNGNLTVIISRPMPELTEL